MMPYNKMVIVDFVHKHHIYCYIHNRVRTITYMRMVFVFLTGLFLNIYSLIVFSSPPLCILHISSTTRSFTFSLLGCTRQVGIIIILGGRRIDITIDENMSHYRHITQSHSLYVANTYRYFRFDILIQGSIDLVRDAVRHDPKYRRSRREHGPTEDLPI